MPPDISSLDSQMQEEPDEKRDIDLSSEVKTQVKVKVPASGKKGPSALLRGLPSCLSSYSWLENNIV